LAVVHVFGVLIFSGAMFHTLAASQIKLFFALVDLPTPFRSLRVTLLVSMAFSCHCGSMEALHISANLICAAI
jgi:hypothetical protein